MSQRPTDEFIDQMGLVVDMFFFATQFDFLIIRDTHPASG